MISLTKKIEAIVIGASAGGIQAVEKILSALPESYSLPIIIVIHLPANERSLLPEVFKHRLKMKVKEVNEKETIESGTVYFAPSAHHVLIEKNKTFSLSIEEPVLFSRPSIDILFKTAADCYGENLVGILLTGANEDGAQGLKKIKEAGGITVVQNPASAEISVMPAAGMPFTSPEYILTLDEIANFLLTLNLVLPPKEKTMENLNPKDKFKAVMKEWKRGKINRSLFQ